MRRTRRVSLKAAGLLLAATAASPVLAQAVPGVMALPEDMPPRLFKPTAATRPDVLADVEALPAPRPAVVTPAPAATAVVPAPAPACAPHAAAKGSSSWSWLHWGGERKASCQAHLWGYPAEFEAPPLGAVMHAHFRTMVANGEAAAMVLYHYDFVEGSDVLNLHGRDQLTKMAARLHAHPFPIVVERTPGAPALAESRRAAILNILTLNNIPIPPEGVVIGPPIAYPLLGIEADRLYSYSLNNQQVQGAPVPIPAGGASVGTGAVGPGSTGAGAGGGGR